MTVTAVRLYLDVDGCFSPLPPFAADPWGDRRDIGARTPVSNLLAAAVAALDVEVTWATTWAGLANEILAPAVGWPDLPVLERHPEVLWWKLDSICATHPAGVPFVWVDDELDTRDRDLDGLIGLMCDTLGVPHLRVCPDPHVGLTPAHLDQIATFASHHSPTVAA